MACSSLGSPTPPPSEDVTFSLDLIKEVADYPNMCMFCDKTLVGVGDKLQTFDTYSTGYIESVIKITKNLLGPKIEYLNSAGIPHMVTEESDSRFSDRKKDSPNLSTSASSG